VGWFVARILRDLVQNLLGAVGFDSLGEKAGLTGKVSLSQLTGLLVFIFVFVPALVAALNTLQIEAISAPATEMLGAFMAAIPDIFAAVIILSIAVVLAKFISGLISTLLEGLGANTLPTYYRHANFRPLMRLSGDGNSFYLQVRGIGGGAPSIHEYDLLPGGGIPTQYEPHFPESALDRDLLVDAAANRLYRASAFGYLVDVWDLSMMSRIGGAAMISRALRMATRRPSRSCLAERKLNRISGGSAGSADWM